MQSWIEDERKKTPSLVQDHSWVDLRPPPSVDKYQNWLNKNLFGEMGYLKSHLPQKSDPQRYFPQFQSALVMTHEYVPHPFPKIPWPNLRIALYAQGLDYHHWIRDLHHRLIEHLKSVWPGFQGLSMVDSGPVIERDLAARAGLGWVGKNSMLINPKRGSFYFLSEIYTNIPVNTTPEVLPDFCGTCDRCIRACPTQAILPDRTLKAEDCISYLTIETRTPPAEFLRPKMGDHVFGCDICQTVCPWNQKVFGKNLEAGPLRSHTEESRNQLTSEIRDVLKTSNHKLNKILKGTALSRAGAKGLFKNLLIVVANQNLKQLEPDLHDFAERAKIQKWPDLVELSQWCINQIQKSIQS